MHRFEPKMRLVRHKRKSEDIAMYNRMTAGNGVLLSSRSFETIKRVMDGDTRRSRPFCVGRGGRCAGAAISHHARRSSTVGSKAAQCGNHCCFHSPAFSRRWEFIRVVWAQSAEKKAGYCY